MTTVTTLHTVKAPPAGPPVRLLVTYYAKPATRQCAKWRRRRTPLPARFVLSSERLRFVEQRAGVPGGAVIQDAHGRRYYCPTDYLGELS